MRMSAETMLRRLAGQGRDDTLGGRIWRARDAMDLSQEALAGQLGLSRETVAGWEGDRDEPRTNSLFQLAGVLGVSPAWLIAGIGLGPDSDGTEESPLCDPTVAEHSSTGRALSDLHRELQILKAQHAATGATIARLEAAIRKLT